MGIPYPPDPKEPMERKDRPRAKGVRRSRHTPVSDPTFRGDFAVLSGRWTSAQLLIYPRRSEVALKEMRERLSGAPSSREDSGVFLGGGPGFCTKL